MAEQYIRILKKAHAILLVDWPNIDLPLSLLKAGFTVFSYAPDNYSIASIEITSDGKEKLIFKKLDEQPARVDIVNIFRPEGEHEEIIARHALPLNAKAVWLHPPVTSANTAVLASKNSLLFVEGIDITAAKKYLDYPVSHK